MVVRFAAPFVGIGWRRRVVGALTLDLHDIAWAPDGKIWSAYRDTTVSVRDARTGAVVRTLGASRDANSLSFALSPDGKKVAMQGASPTQIELRDTRDGYLLNRANAGYFADLDFSPDGTLVAINQGGCATSYVDASTGKLRNTLTDNGFFSEVLPRDRNTGFAVFNTLDRKLDKIGVRDTRSGAWLRVWKRGGSGLGSLAVSRDGKTVAASSDSTLYRPTDPRDGITLFNARTGRASNIITDKGVFARLSFSPDGTRLAAAPHQTASVRVWDVATGRELFRVEHHANHGFNADSTVALSWSPDGSRLATASADDTLLLWDGHTGRPKPFSSSGH